MYRLGYLPRHTPAPSSVLERVQERPGVCEAGSNPHHPSETGNTSFISSSKCKTSLQNYSSTYLSQETTVAKVDHQDLKESRGHSDVISSCIGDPYRSYCEEVRGQGLHSTWTGSAQREILEMCLASDLLCKRAQSGSFVRP